MTPQDYEKMADKFLMGTPGPSVLQCKRSKGDVVRFDQTSGVYGVLDSNNCVRTFFKPVPCASVPTAQRAAVKSRGRCHDHPTNLLYFQWDCGRF